MPKSEQLELQVEQELMQITLNCSHVLLYREPYPMRGEELWCSDCGKGRIVQRAPERLTVRCRPCRMARPVCDEFEARTIASNHRADRKYRDHTVLIFDGVEEIDRVGPPPDPGPLPF